LHNQRLAVAAFTDRIMETRLTGLGCVMVPRQDGNGTQPEAQATPVAEVPTDFEVEL
jgi:hypothetical protein